MAENNKKKLGPGRHLSAIKRHRQSTKRSAQNKAALSEVRTALKKLRGAINDKDAKVAKELFVKTQSLVDRAIKKGLLAAQTGHRSISRLHRQVSAL